MTGNELLKFLLNQPKETLERDVLAYNAFYETYMQVSNARLDDGFENDDGDQVEPSIMLCGVQ